MLGPARGALAGARGRLTRAADRLADADRRGRRRPRRSPPRWRDSAATLVHLAVVGPTWSALVVLFAIDLDQRLLPERHHAAADRLRPRRLRRSARARSSTRSKTSAGLPRRRSSSPLGLALLAIPFGAGAIGQGDLKLLVSVGLFDRRARTSSTASSRAPSPPASSSRVLLVVRRLSMRSYVPYGPFLIAGALWAILALPQP